MSPLMVGAVSAGSVVGMAVGAMAGGWTSDRIGRRGEAALIVFLSDLGVLCGDPSTAHLDSGVGLDPRFVGSWYESQEVRGWATALPSSLAVLAGYRHFLQRIQPFAEIGYRVRQ